MTYQHQNLADGRWNKLSFAEQMANIGSEVYRAISAKNRGKQEYSKQSFYRALELTDLTIRAQVKRPGLKELTRMRELLVDYFYGDNIYNSTSEFWEKYFYQFNYAARLNK